MKKLLMLVLGSIVISMLYGCNNNAPFNEMSDRKMKSIINEELPAGSSKEQVMGFLIKHKIAHGEDAKNVIGALIRPPMGNFVLFFPHTDYYVEFIFDSDDKLLRYTWTEAYTGP